MQDRSPNYVLEFLCQGRSVPGIVSIHAQRFWDIMEFILENQLTSASEPHLIQIITRMLRFQAPGTSLTFLPSIGCVCVCMSEREREIVLGVYLVWKCLRAQFYSFIVSSNDLHTKVYLRETFGNENRYWFNSYYCPILLGRNPKQICSKLRPILFSGIYSLECVPRITILIV